MGQYWSIVNVDKKELLNPHVFGEGVKLCEFGLSSSGSMTALSLLLVSPSCGGGGGDYDAEHPLLGSWYGDRIALIGDYTELADFPSGLKSTEDAKDISFPALQMILKDDCYADSFFQSVEYIYPVYLERTKKLIDEALERDSLTEFMHKDTLAHVVSLLKNSR